MNINKSFMEDHVFNEKKSEYYYGGNIGTDFNVYPKTLLTGGVPIIKLLSKSTPNIKSLSHLGVPAGLVSTPCRTTGGGKSLTHQSVTNNIASYNNELTNKLFSKIEHKS